MRTFGILDESLHINREKGWIAEQRLRKGKEIQVMVKGLIAAFLVSVVMLLILAFLLLKLQWDTQKTELAVMAVYVLSALAGGWMTGHGVERKKFLYGLVIGILYFLLLLAVSAMSDPGIGAAPASGITAFLLCAVGGMLGGMLA